eukprot:12159697-Ditylum_brightwellii.AAC.1
MKNKQTVLPMPQSLLDHVHLMNSSLQYQPPSKTGSKSSSSISQHTKEHIQMDHAIKVSFWAPITTNNNPPPLLFLEDKSKKDSTFIEYAGDEWGNILTSPDPIPVVRNKPTNEAPILP